MFLWFAAFWLVGSWAVPGAATALGFERSQLTYRGQAIYSLVTDIAEMLVGLGILMRCLARFRPHLAAGWFWFFPFKWRPGLWVLDTLVGCLLFPVVNMLSQINTDLLPPIPRSFASSPIEQSLSAKDPIANLLYVVVVSVCAPIWEEIIFRGFLLSSLTRYMPLWGSVSVSALVFALAHFSIARLLPLSFLGVVMGVIFVRSRNLLACMVLHSMWNAFVFLELLR
jgi:membrane protease YdiL (CAAX protease family)